MRLPIGLAAIALLGLLGGSLCASTAIALQASNAADPTAAEVLNEVSMTTNMSVGSEAYTSAVNACVSGAPGHLQEGADAHLFCDCAVDRIADGTTPPEAIAQCTAELQITGPAPRTGEISECVSGSPGHLPAGTDANAFCTCAVDKMMLNSEPQTEAIDQCATEMHITLPTQE